MFQVRFHGRGGHGMVTAAELLPVAAASEGRHAQAFPSFGSDRTGAPAMSFCRIDDKPIRTYEPVTEPDALIILDPALPRQADLFAGLGHDGYMLINAERSFGELGLEEFVKPFRRDRLLVVPASSLALTHLGRPLPGAALLGGFAALTWVVSLNSVLAAINERFTGPVAAGNEKAARAAFNFVRDEREALTHALSKSRVPAVAEAVAWNRSSDPHFAIAFIASPACTAMNVPRLPSPRLISMWIRPAASGSITGQP